MFIYIYIFALGIWYKPHVHLEPVKYVWYFRTPTSWGDTKINALVSDFSQNNFMLDLDRKINYHGLPSRGLTYPTLGKGKSSSKVPFLGNMLVLKWVTLPSNISPPVWDMWVDYVPFPFKGIWTPFLKGVGLLDQIAIFAYTPQVHTIFPVHSISWDLEIDMCACMIMYVHLQRSNTHVYNIYMWLH